MIHLVIDAAPAAAVPPEQKDRAHAAFWWQTAMAFMNLNRLKEALAVLQKLDALRKDVPHVLDMMQQILGKLLRYDEQLVILERILPLLKGEEKEKLAAFIAAMRGGTRPKEPPQWGSNDLSALIERCMDPDVEVRRKALFEYYELSHRPGL